MYDTTPKQVEDNKIVVLAPKQRLRWFAAGRKQNRSDGRIVARSTQKKTFRREKCLE